MMTVLRFWKGTSSPWLTKSNPVTLTMSDATDGEDGCTSSVVTLCSTLLKGSDYNFFFGLSVIVPGLSPSTRTVSFSIMFFVPWSGVPSKVSMDVSR